MDVLLDGSYFERVFFSAFAFIVLYLFAYLNQIVVKCAKMTTHVSKA